MSRLDGRHNLFRHYLERNAGPEAVETFKRLEDYAELRVGLVATSDVEAILNVLESLCDEICDLSSQVEDLEYQVAEAETRCNYEE